MSGLFLPHTFRVETLERALIAQQYVQRVNVEDSVDEDEEDSVAALEAVELESAMQAREIMSLRSRNL